jgi:hypothetical protein
MSVAAQAGVVLIGETRSDHQRPIGGRRFKQGAKALAEISPAIDLHAKAGGRFGGVDGRGWDRAVVSGTQGWTHKNPEHQADQTP